MGARSVAPIFKEPKLTTMVMHPKDAETRIRLLEQQVAQLTEILQPGQEKGSIHCFSSEFRPPALRFIHAKDGGDAHSFGLIAGGDFGNGYEALRISGEGQARLDLISGSDLLLQAGDNLHVNAPNVRIEARRMSLDGELSARLCQSGPFEWRSGQPPVRLVHQSHGFPVLTELKGKFKSTSSGIRLYVSPEDGYWYLAGNSGEGAEIFARVVCIGRV